MTKALADATTTVANANHAMVVPVGLAFARALRERPDLGMTVADNRHPTAAGSYLEGAVLFATLTKTSPEGAKFNGGGAETPPPQHAGDPALRQGRRIPAARCLGDRDGILRLEEITGFLRRASEAPQRLRE